jgi:hypothetical protein
VTLFLARAVGMEFGPTYGTSHCEPFADIELLQGSIVHCFPSQVRRAFFPGLRKRRATRWPSRSLGGSVCSCLNEFVFGGTSNGV